MKTITVPRKVYRDLIKRLEAWREWAGADQHWTGQQESNFIIEAKKLLKNRKPNQ